MFVLNNFISKRNYGNLVLKYFDGKIEMKFSPCSMMMQHPLTKCLLAFLQGKQLPQKLLISTSLSDYLEQTDNLCIFPLIKVKLKRTRFSKN